MTARKQQSATQRKRTSEHSASPNEGEGNRTAARAYNADQHRFVESGEVEKKAREAKHAFEGKEGEQLRRAEELGKRHSQGEDPEVKR
jgi:hypothetical protein